MVVPHARENGLRVRDALHVVIAQPLVGLEPLAHGASAGFVGVKGRFQLLKILGEIPLPVEPAGFLGVLKI